MVIRATRPGFACVLLGQQFADRPGICVLRRIASKRRPEHDRLAEVTSFSPRLRGPDEVVAAVVRRANLNVANMQRRGAAETHDRGGVGTRKQQVR